MKTVADLFNGLPSTIKADEKGKAHFHGGGKEPQSGDDPDTLKTVADLFNGLPATTKADEKGQARFHGVRKNRSRVMIPIP